MENNTKEKNNRFIGKFIPYKMLPKNENGLASCRFCNKIVYPPRRTMCSKECAHELRLRTSGKYLRNFTYKRDKGICNLCKTDTKIISQTALILLNNNLVEEFDIFLKLNRISKKRKIWKKKNGGGLWDADHIITVKDGGGQCGMNNIQTLCIKCHKNKTFSK